MCSKGIYLGFRSSFVLVSIWFAEELPKAAWTLVTLVVSLRSIPICSDVFRGSYSCEKISVYERLNLHWHNFVGWIGSFSLFIVWDFLYSLTWSWFFMQTMFITYCRVTLVVLVLMLLLVGVDWCWYWNCYWHCYSYCLQSFQILRRWIWNSRKK